MKRTRIIGAGVLALAIGAAVTVAIVVDYTDGARPGEAVADIDDFDVAHKAEVRLPFGTLGVTVGTPEQEYEVDYDQTTKAADGAVVVPVGWEKTGSPNLLATSVPIYQFQLTLVADGRRYDLQAGRTAADTDDYQPVVTSDKVAVVVEGSGENLSLEVEYDGLTQVVDVDSGKVEPGLAAPYYARGGLKTLTTSDSCSVLSAADAKDVTANLDQCKLGPATLAPYFPGKGWVSSASESWVSVPYSLLTASFQRRGSVGSYSTELRRFDVTLDGAAPVDDVQRYRNRGTVSISGTKVFRTSGTPKTLSLTTEVFGDSRYDGSGTRLFRNVQSFPLR